MTYKEREQKKIDKIFEGQTEIDTPIVGNKVSSVRGWQITSRTGFAIEKEKVIIIRINNRKPIIFSLSVWKAMSKVSSGILNDWQEDLEEVQGKDVLL